MDVVKGIRRAVDSLAPAESDGDDGGWGTPPQPKSKLPVATSTTNNVPNTTPAQQSAAGRSPMELINALARLPGPQFSQLLFVVNPPPGVLPTGVAPQLDQAKALLTWARNDPNYSLGQVEQVLDEILGNR